MIGEARFTYTDADIIAAQCAAWSWLVRVRNLAIAWVVLTALNLAILAVLDAAYGTRGVPNYPVYVVAGSAAETLLFVWATFMGARNHGRQVLRSRPTWAWGAGELRGEQAWAWQPDALHVTSERGRADVAWTSVGAWLDAPKVLLLYPPGRRAFSLPEPVLAAGWRNAPKLLIFPFGGYATALPKRALAAGDAGRLVAALRAAGVPERRRFGLIAARAVAG